MKIKHKVSFGYERDQNKTLATLLFACSNKAINCGKTKRETGNERVRESQSVAKTNTQVDRVRILKSCGQLVLESDCLPSTLRIRHIARKLVEDSK